MFDFALDEDKCIYMISYIYVIITLHSFYYLCLKHVSDIPNSVPNWECTFSQLQMFYRSFLCITGSPFFLKSKANTRKFIVHKNYCVLFPLTFGKSDYDCICKKHCGAYQIWWWPLQACNKVEASFSVGWHPHTQEIMQKELNSVTPT